MSKQPTFVEEFNLVSQQITQTLLYDMETSEWKMMQKDIKNIVADENVPF